ncbi:hypothetical protein PV10_03229 [Exophiala mesophila]|uniref:PSP1 C-terminal domain-containing protein n=1 Tax=Exophiala mesophila TaxID=212818 RepID=A0A0D2A9G8_EXOME|nr:uncharacterized protein PV10_03229 [Exophiala mesophila]KIV95598.1 hypothetical protein PV10_03229 [Exophiala mesophila]
MSQNPAKSSLPTRSPMPAFGTFNAHQAPASLLLEKSNPGLRRSTPDSEALASSDDEVEHPKPTASSNVKTARPARRTSWLTDTSSYNPNRKPSITGPYSPSGSHPGTPGSEISPWTNLNASNPPGWPNPALPTPYTAWNIWGQDSRKDPPLRLQEVLPSNGDNGIPFTIPLQPTPKTYRSQSYSVGQLDTTNAPNPANPLSTSTEATRTRLAGQNPALTRRISRTSGLAGNDPLGLGRLREDENEEDARASSSSIAQDQARMIEMLEKENAKLRHAAQRERTSSATVPGQAVGFRQSRLQGPLLEETEDAIDDPDDFSRLSGYSREGVSRRMSENIGHFAERPSGSSLENRQLDGARRAQWQTSLGFGPIPEAPQSRRHSFADVPTRHGSFSSTGREDDATTYESGSQEISQGDDPAYFNATESTRRAADARVHQAHPEPQSFTQQLGVGAFLEPTSQPLFIVNFKCCRSDVFYIQEGTGLHVNVGDLVIVEADRGTDLGTVQHTNVNWEDARRYKEYYAEEHYKWLMMFSLQSRSGGPNVVNPNGMPGRPGSAVGGMGPQGHQGPHDSAHPDLKPKMIKRLAQNHEIQSLKDKEGNEAKAKRVCQQKVVDHRLNMEILDAEFQMDSKKLTFYYFADNYINFNHLVTDLFKIYKTRIWMSAINPASFQTPTASLGLTPAYGTPSNDERHRRRQPQPQPPQHHQSQQPQHGHVHGQQPVTTPFGDTFDADRTFNGQSQGMRSPYFGQFNDMGGGHQPLQPGVTSFAPGMTSQMDPYLSYYNQPYPALNPNAPNFATNRHDYRGRGTNQGGDVNWMGRFQGLSLGS